MCAISTELDRLSQNDVLDSEVFRQQVALRLDDKLTEITDLAAGKLVFSSTETWRTVYQQVLESADAKRYLSVALIRTDDYWRRWCKRTRVPVDYQDAVLRASMTLKLHTFEDTGAVIAATTTSIPEAHGTGRMWDYRYCWVRDAAFVIRTQLRMGHSEDASRFCEYLRNLVPLDGHDAFELQPVYGIDHRTDLT